MLKRVNVILEEMDTDIAESEPYEKAVDRQEVLAALRKELASHNIVLHTMTPEAYEHQRAVHSMSRLPQHGDTVVDSLYISDSEPALRTLLANKECVILLLSDANKSSSFPEITYAAESLDGIDYAYLEQVYLRFLGLPWTILETERCVLREITTTDVPKLYDIYAEPEVACYVEGLYEDMEEEIEYTKAYIDKVYAFYGYGMWIVEDKQTGAMIGRAGIEYKDERSGVELGFLIAKPFWRQGLAYEVVQAIMEYTAEKLDIHSIYTVVQEENKKSTALCRKLGFQRVGNKKIEDRQYYVFEKSI